MKKLKKFIRREIKKTSAVPPYDEMSRGIWMGRLLTLDEIQKEIEKSKLIKIKKNTNGNSKIKCK